jgi:hypothetical protein
MGIKNYHKWMKENHPNAFKTRWLDTYDHLYIDLNFALHWAYFGTQNINQIWGKLYALLDKIIHKTYPIKSIVIANDGPAPVAKLLLQRSRRSYTGKEIENIENSSLIFTPGTKFMDSVQDNLNEYFKKIKLIYNIEVNFMLGCEGEAELKLKKKIMNNLDNNNDDTHIIISNDADIIAMFGTFNIKDIFNIFVYCDLRVNKDEIMSLGVLLEAHTAKYGISKNFGKDFTFISILVGNDYLPKINYVDLDKLWDGYKIWINLYKNGIINDDLVINIDFFIKIINHAVNNTKKYLLQSFNIDDYKSHVYKDYMEGVLWCVDMYNKGQCYRYNYMYKSDDTPNPLGLIFNLYAYPEITKLNNINSSNANSNLYAILVFPRKALILIDKKYHKFAKKCDILYEEEDCEICQEFYDKLNILDSKNAEYKLISKNLKLHKKIHPRLNVHDIQNIIDNFNEEFNL